MPLEFVLSQLNTKSVRTAYKIYSTQRKSCFIIVDSTDATVNIDNEKAASLVLCDTSAPLDTSDHTYLVWYRWHGFELHFLIYSNVRK